MSNVKPRCVERQPKSLIIEPRRLRTNPIAQHSKNRAGQFLPRASTERR
jgi:hypothetical protein